MNRSESRFGSRRRVIGGALVAGAVGLALAGPALAGLVAGSLPSGGFTFTSTTVNSVAMGANGIHLKTKGPIDVKTTYSRVAPSAALLGWHYHNGPVIVTVTVGTLTLFDGACQPRDLTPGQSLIESTGDILNGFVDPAKNGGVATVEWLTTRLYPAGAADPVPVPAPCAP
ncbi:MAG TPA: hypothetical protein VM427_00595 [Patescibacteria group bacterium]|nr:hypothetical protein [Patescibacteria group bacterium]